MRKLFLVLISSILLIPSFGVAFSVDTTRACEMDKFKDYCPRCDSKAYGHYCPFMVPDVLIYWYKYVLMASLFIIMTIFMIIFVRNYNNLSMVDPHSSIAPDLQWNKNIISVIWEISKNNVIKWLYRIFVLIFIISISFYFYVFWSQRKMQNVEVFFQSEIGRVESMLKEQWIYKPWVQPECEPWTRWFGSAW
jgi:hypothetical protein